VVERARIGEGIRNKEFRIKNNRNNRMDIIFLLIVFHLITRKPLDSLELA